MAIKPTPPPFEAKGKKKPAPAGNKEDRPTPAKGTPAKKAPKPEATRRKTGDVPTPKVIPAPKEMTTPPFKNARKVTAGPYHDDQAKYRANWTVITRAGDVVEYHRFENEAAARAFAEAVGR